MEMSETKLAPTAEDEARADASPVVLSAQEVKARSRRNWIIAGALLGFVVLVFIITLVRLGANVLDRPI